MFDWYEDTKRNRLIIVIAVGVLVFLFKVGALDRLFKPWPLRSPPPQVMNDGSVRYTMPVKTFRERPGDTGWKIRGKETWVVRLKDIAACEKPGEDGICRKWTFTIQEPYFKPWDNGGGASFRFWLKYPELTLGPDSEVADNPRFDPDYIQVSTAGTRTDPPKHDPVTDTYTGIGSGQAEDLTSVCRKDVEVSPGLVRLREATQAERDAVTIPDYRKAKGCLNQNDRQFSKGTDTAIVDGSGNTMMRISPGALPPEHRYLYYDKDGMWRAAGYCSLDRKTKEQQACYFDLYLPPRRMLSITFNAKHLSDFYAIHDRIINLMTNATETIDWEPYEK